MRLINKTKPDELWLFTKNIR